MGHPVFGAPTAGSLLPTIMEEGEGGFCRAYPPSMRVPSWDRGPACQALSWLRSYSPEDAPQAGTQAVSHGSARGHVAEQSPLPDLQARAHTACAVQTGVVLARGLASCRTGSSGS